ncbi:MAG: alpha-L-glutamate ligase-like protein [Marivibrio sp.]|uniref:alpha-L-glutamate ligase-like protein n=1 Tax=Marivibrio sp. TaxID=2039719 RepID=UPI0032EB8503
MIGAFAAKLPLATPGELRANGVLGLNRRNLHYVQGENRRALYPLVDDKRQTKRLLESSGVATPKLLGVIEGERDADSCLQRMADAGEGFVVKPAKGSAGKGVTVIEEVLANRRGRILFRTAGGDLLSLSQLRHHLSNILSGVYSFGDRRDSAVVEEVVHPAPPFTEIVWEGIPDIRIVVMRGYPVMAMGRLPTLESDGRGNLHQGAVGVGIRIADGAFAGGQHKNRFISEHPDTLRPLDGYTVPDWGKMLRLAARCTDLVGLGFLGVDIVVDRERGPLILELNARPGVSIQLANRCGLEARLAKAEAWAEAGDAEDAEPADARVARAQAGFA